MSYKETLVETFKYHIHSIMGCDSSMELSQEILSLTKTLKRFDYPTDSKERIKLMTSIKNLDRGDYYSSKIKLSKLLTVMLSLIKINI